MRTNWIWLGAVAALTPVGFSCGGGPVSEAVQDFQAMADETLTSVENAGNLNYLASLYARGMVVQGSSSARVAVAQTDEEVGLEYAQETADAILAALQAEFQECVSAYPDDEDPLTIGVTFDCGGGDAMYAITGTLSGVLTPVVSQLSVVSASALLETTDLKINDVSVVGSLVVDYDVATEAIDVAMDVGVTGPDGVTLALTFTGAGATDLTCTSLEGSLNAEGNGHLLAVTVSGFERCEGACPAAGGVIDVSVSGDEGTANLEITFDGSSTASVVTGKGDTLSVDTQCGGVTL